MTGIMLIRLGQAGFFKSSPKVTLTPKSTKFNFSRQSLSASPKSGQQAKPSPPHPPVNATWICPICSFSNAIPPSFDPGASNENTPLPPCQACGIKPPLVTVVKAAIASMSNRSLGTDSTSDIHNTQLATTALQQSAISDIPENTVQCPRCTFLNHSSLLSCELCGTALKSRPESSSSSDPTQRRFSPAPGQTGLTNITDGDTSDGIKFSFHAGGEKVFIERLRGALTQKKWLLQSAPPVPKQAPSTDQTDETSSGVPSHSRTVGIAGLEKRGLDMRKNNELVIGNAFEDLAALMASAKDIIALAENFASQTKHARADGAEPTPSEEASSQAQDPAALLSQLNLTTTKDMLSANGINSADDSSSLYQRELSRSLAEFLTDDARGVLRFSGGIMSLVDLWAVFNRARGGVELISPTDLSAAAELFDKLSLPVRLRKFKSGLIAVQERSRTDDKTVATLLRWLKDLREFAGAIEAETAPWDFKRWGRGVTAQETAERFGWSVGVAVEELEIAEDRGAVCRENCLEGVRFWQNWFLER